ncbi:MAG: hypothetical protein ACRDD7_08300 [Peptostreptococcaceae bacterium]
MSEENKDKVIESYLKLLNRLDKAFIWYDNNKGVKDDSKAYKTLEEIVAALRESEEILLELGISPLEVINFNK